MINRTNIKFCCSSEGSAKEPYTRMFPESMLVTEKKRKKSKCASIGKQKMNNTNYTMEYCTTVKKTYIYTSTQMNLRKMICNKSRLCVCICMHICIYMHIHTFKIHKNVSMCLYVYKYVFIYIQTIYIVKAWMYALFSQHCFA